MQDFKAATLVQISITNSGIAQAYFTETPATLSLATPSGAVQVKIANFPASNARLLPNSQPHI